MPFFLRNRARLRAGLRRSPAAQGVAQPPWSKASFLGRGLASINPLARVASLGYLERSRQLLDWRIGLLTQQLNRLQGFRNNIASASGDFEGPIGTADGDYLSVEGETGGTTTPDTGASTGSPGTSGNNGTTTTSGISARMWDQIFNETHKRTENGYPLNREVQQKLEDRDLGPISETIWHPEFDAYLHRKEAREHASEDEGGDDRDHDKDKHLTKPDRDDYKPLFARIIKDQDSVYFTKYPTLSLNHVKKWLERNNYKYDKNGVLKAWKDFQRQHEQSPDDDDYRPLFKRIINDHDSVYFTKYPNLSLTHVKRWLEQNHYKYDKNGVLEAWEDFRDRVKTTESH
jgi:hypothetical protein